MTNLNPTSGNAPGLSALMEHIQEMQSKATRLCGLLAAVNFLENEGECDQGRVALCGIAEDLANEINLGLDYVSLPQVSAR